MNIQQQTLLLAAFLTTGMISCNADTSEKEGIIVESPAAAEPIVNAQATSVPAASTPAAVEVQPVTPQPQAVVLNPAHGQPGHDCAVAVGAPLTGSVAGNLPTTATTPVRTGPALPNFMGGAGVTTSANNTAGSGSQRLNPAHGQPGHDCSVAVGAPLPS